MKRNTMSVRKFMLMAIIVAVTMVMLVIPCYAYNFDDVPSDHWAYSDIQNAHDHGWINGIGNNLYAPEDPVTQAQWWAMITRAVYPHEVETAELNHEWYANDWYAKNVHVSRNKGLSKLLPINIINYSHINNMINREEMACIVGAVLSNFNKTMTDEQYQALAQQIPDFTEFKGECSLNDYSYGVLLSYQYGVITGVDQTGRFDGSGLMTRSQAATVLCRLMKVLDLDSSYENTTPEMIPDPESSVSGIEKIPDHWSQKSAAIKALGKKDIYNAAVQSLKDIDGVRVNPDQAVRFNGTNYETHSIEHALSKTGLLKLKYLNKDASIWIASDLGLTKEEETSFLNGIQGATKDNIVFSAAMAMMQSDYQDGFDKEQMAKKFQAYLNLAGIPSIYYENMDEAYGDAPSNYWLYALIDGSWTIIRINAINSLYWQDPSLLMMNQAEWQFDMNHAPVGYLDIINRDGSIENLAMNLIMDAAKGN